MQPNRADPLMKFNLSTKVLEWMQLGLAAVVGVTPPLADMFTDDELWLCAPGDLEGLCACIKEADADPQAVSRRAERARVASKRFRFEDQIEVFVRAIEGGTG